jgi:DNA-directed RNA polymerase specialized sigma24 family protein
VKGWRRPTSGTAEEREQLLEQARELGERVEATRQQMLDLAAERQRVIHELYERGMSVRELAAALEVSPAVVSAAMRAGRRSASAL